MYGRLGDAAAGESAFHAFSAQKSRSSSLHPRACQQVAVRGAHNIYYSLQQLVVRSAARISLERRKKSYVKSTEFHGTMGHARHRNACRSMDAGASHLEC